MFLSRSRPSIAKKIPSVKRPPAKTVTDRHTLFAARRHDARERASVGEQLAVRQTETQLGRVFEQLHITSIAARSPQAKGRVERLWGRFKIGW
ncbi:hypothetical protein [Ktedonobacter sp. SOSP1-85]|uniref:hypothetical protein n=1 Tax=Ktedonobacter sp. SOSP1-85 TaxID=2778367 RepID=UPI001916C82D|nr:hypothetical protein [Ktedonobacter sp. SOSP1-85]